MEKSKNSKTTPQRLIRKGIMAGYLNNNSNKLKIENYGD